MRNNTGKTNGSPAMTLPTRITNNKDSVFGKANRPQTPVKHIISGDFGNEAEWQIH